MNIKDEFNIVWYVLCWNEIQILPFIIDYWKTIARKVIVYDNGSTDGTIEYLQKYDWIEVRYFDTGNTFNDRIHMNIKNECWKEQKGKDIDFVIVSDLDEILWGKNLYEDIKYIKDNNISIVKPSGYNFMSLKFPEYKENVLLHEQVKKCYSHIGYSKPILFNPNLVDEINYCPGAHNCSPRMKTNIMHSDSIFVFHFKCLGLDYLLNRNNNVLKNRLSRENLMNRWGVHYLNSIERTTQEFNDDLNKCINVDDILK
jgi:glycosyltransferase involved in cell wall biosynthesis